MRYLALLMLVCLSVPASAQQMYWVKLQVSGTAAKANLTYDIGGVKRRKTGVPLPWTELTLGENQAKVTLTAQNPTGAGGLDLKIYAKPITAAELDEYNKSMIRISAQLDSLKSASLPGIASYDRRYEEIQRSDSLRVVRENAGMVLLSSSASDSTHADAKATAILK